MRAAKFLVRVRSWTRPTRVYDRGGWRDTVRWSKWATVESFATYAEAAAFRDDDRFKKGLQRAAVWYKGKPYREQRNAQGELLGILTGDDALLGRVRNRLGF